MVNDYENVNRFIGGKKKSFTVEQELQWVQEKLEEKALVFSMIDKASGRFIGNIELMDPNDSEGELGIAITAEMQDQGHGTEAVLAMVNYAIDHLGLKRVFLRTNPQNARAIRVYEKCGFSAITSCLWRRARRINFIIMYGLIEVESDDRSLI